MNNRRCHRRRFYPARSLAFLLTGLLSAVPACAELMLADNAQVLEAWQKLAQNGAASPELIRQEGGATTIEWHGDVTVEGYNNTISGNSLLTPLQSGSFYKSTIQGDLRKTLASGGLSYMQFSATHTDDRAVLSNNSQLDLFQAGVVEQDYSLLFGDVVAGYSTLGTNTQVKGIQGQASFKRMTLSVSVGKLAESWEVLAGTVDNSQYESDVHAVKLEMPVGEQLNLFISNQAFSEDEESLSAELRAVTAAKADTSTAGFVFQQGSFSLQGEYGSSRWEESSGYSYDDSATVIDGQWRVSKGGLSAGYHDIGGYYSSLSADVTAGVRERYVGADWLPLSWLSVILDLRRSDFEHAYYASDIETTDAITTQLGVSLDKVLAGLNLSLQQSLSRGSTVDESRNDVEDYAVNLAYTSQYWGVQLGNSQQQVENSAYPDTNSKTDTWSYGMNVSLNQQADIAGLWAMDLGLNGSWQKQEYVTVADIENRNYTLSLNAQRVGWGNLVASYTKGNMSQSGGVDLEQQQIQLEASRNWGRQNTVKFYLRENENSGDPDSNYSEKTAGVQLALVW